MLKIGHKLKSLRRLNNLTPQDISNTLKQKYNITISSSAIYKWEEDIVEPDIHILIALSEIFHSSISFILDDTILELHNLSKKEYMALDKFRTDETFMKISMLLIKLFYINK